MNAITNNPITDDQAQAAINCYVQWMAEPPLGLSGKQLLQEAFRDAIWVATNPGLDDSKRPETNAHRVSTNSPTAGTDDNHVAPEQTDRQPTGRPAHHVPDGSGGYEPTGMDRFVRAIASIRDLGLGKTKVIPPSRNPPSRHAIPAGEMVELLPGECAEFLQVQLTFGRCEVIGCYEWTTDGHCVLLFTAPKTLRGLPLGTMTEVASALHPLVTLVFPTKTQALQVLKALHPPGLNHWSRLDGPALVELIDGDRATVFIRNVGRSQDRELVFADHERRAIIALTGDTTQRLFDLLRAELHGGAR